MAREGSILFSKNYCLKCGKYLYKSAYPRFDLCKKCLKEKPNFERW